MINLNVKGITIQMHIVVNDDGSFTVRYGEGNVSLEALDASDLATSRAITLNTPKPAENEDQVLMTESEMGAKLAGLIREAIEKCVDHKTLCTHNVKTVEHRNDELQKKNGGVVKYYEDSTKMYTPPPPPEDEDTSDKE